MDPEHWRKIERIYNGALELEPDRREEFLAQACSGDESLRIEIEALLRSGSGTGNFMKSPALAFAARAAAEETSSEGVSFHSGRELSHYRIGELIGRGGMGEVYRAEDTRLRRQVAIKVLPADFARDPERLARLEREARVLASLSHPNIAGIHELEEADGVRFLVMELVEGKTLAERLKKGPLPLDEALRICCRIAEGLEAAHGKGVIHRDLKPSNVKVAPDGKVKILDFGLAKALQGPEAPADSQAVTDITDEMTKPGVILGTAAYMSPEQAKGQAVDKRTDIWAFGCILYECLAGKRAFAGNTVSETLAAVIKEEPGWAALPKGTPEKIRDLLKHCLNKDPDRRLHDVADARIELEDCLARSSEAEPAAMASKSRRVFAFTGLAAVVIALLVAGWFLLSRSPSTAEAPPTVVPLITYPGLLDGPTFSPDGNEIAFSWNGEKRDNEDIYRKMIGPGEPLRLTSDPAPDIRPAWSPDGRFIAFLRVRGIEKTVLLVPALGGAEIKVAETVALGGDNNVCLGVAWSPDSRWLVVTDRNDRGQTGIPQSPNAPPKYGLHLVSVDTGEMRELTVPPRDVRFGDRGASFSPDGRALAFARHIDFNRSEVYRLSLTDDMRPKGEPERLVYENRRVYGVLWTQDGKDILYSSGNFMSSESFLRRISISEPKADGGYRNIQESFGEGAWALAISPDGRRLAYARYSQDRDIYRLELPGKDGQVKAAEKFISSTRTDYAPDYSPKGAIAFTSTRTGSEEIWMCNGDGSSPRQLSSMGGPQTCNPSWSPDGETIVFDSRKEGSSDVYVVKASGGSPRRMTSEPSYDGTASWSRDGKWVYFVSNRSGQSEVYRIPAGGGEPTQVTKNGGGFALESPDGKWIYFCKPFLGRRAIWKVAATGGEESEVHPGSLSYADDFVVLEDGIYLSKNDGSLEFLDFANGRSREIARLESHMLYFFGLTLSPDRRFVLYARVHPPTSDLMLVENFR